MNVKNLADHIAIEINFFVKKRLNQITLAFIKCIEVDKIGRSELFEELKLIR